MIIHSTYEILDIKEEPKEEQIPEVIEEQTEEVKASKPRKNK